MKTYLRYLLITLTLLFCLPSQIAIGKTLRVGVLPTPPFVTIKKDHYSGLSIDLWQNVARKLQWDYQFIPVKGSFNEAIQRVAEGKLDALVGPTSVIHARLKLVDFSRPYYINRTVLVLKNQRPSFLQTLSNFFFSSFMYALLGIVAIYIIFSHIIWLLERHYAGNYSRGYWRGIGYAYWSLFCSFSTRSPAQTEASHPSTRIISGLWGILSWVILVNISAIVTAALTVSLVKNDSITKTSDLRNERIAVTQGSSNVLRAEQLGAIPVPVKNIQAGLTMVKEDKVLGVLDDYGVAKYWLGFPEYRHLKIANIHINYDEFGFIFPKNSKLVDAFDLQLKHLQHNAIARDICRKYVDDKQAELCDL